jgi:hypothetical protein
MKKRDKTFAMEVSLTFFEVAGGSDKDFKDPSKRVFSLSLPSVRGSAEMSTAKQAPKMLIATMSQDIPLALDNLQKELNLNIDYLKQKFMEMAGK